MEPSLANTRVRNAHHNLADVGVDVVLVCPRCESRRFRADVTVVEAAGQRTVTNTDTVRCADCGLSNSVEGLTYEQRVV